MFLTLLLILQLNFTDVSQEFPTYEFRSTSSYKTNTLAPLNTVNNKNYNNDNYSNNTVNNNRNNKPKKVSGTGWIDYYIWGYWNGVPSTASNEDMYAYY